MFNLINKISRWYSTEGIVIFYAIAYFFTLILTFIQPVALIIVLCVVKLPTGAIVGIAFGIVLGFFLDLVLCGLTKGQLEFVENCVYAYKNSRQIKNVINNQKERILETKPETAKSTKPSVVKTEPKPIPNQTIAKGEGYFLQTYFGQSSNHESVRVAAGTVVKIIKRNDDATYDIEYKDGTKKVVITKVQPHYIKINQ